MKANKFYLLKDIKGDSDFHRKVGKHNVKGVYFWGFTLNDNASLPNNKNELVIYYIGKDTRSVVRRIMEEVTQLIFGGYGTIIDHAWLQRNPHSAGILEKQKSYNNNKGSKLADGEVLYNSDGLHVLYEFFNDPKIRPTIEWMRERLIFSWIEVSDNAEIGPLELEMHSYGKGNILGTGRRVKFPHNNKFNEIDWNQNNILKEWLLEVKNKASNP